jgi:hypothetical protein
MTQTIPAAAAGEGVGAKMQAMIADHANKMAAVARGAHAIASGLPVDVATMAATPLPGSSQTSSTVNNMNQSFGWPHVAAGLGGLLTIMLSLIGGWMASRLGSTPPPPAVAAPPAVAQSAKSSDPNYHLRLLPTTEQQ